MTDTAALVAVEAAALGAGSWSAELVAAELEALHRHVVLAQDGEDVVGWAVLLLGDPADVLRVAVAPSSRRRGVGRALLDALLAHAENRPVLLEVEADNVAAVAMYAGAGFTEIDRRRGYYGPGRDALVLRRAPTDSRASDPRYPT